MHSRDKLESMNVINKRRGEVTDEQGIKSSFDDFLTRLVDEHPELAGSSNLSYLRDLALDTRGGLQKGYKKYGANAFYKFNMISMAREELRDLFNYIFFEYVKYDRRKRRKGVLEKNVDRYNASQQELMYVAYHAVCIYVMLAKIKGLRAEPRKAT